MSSERIDWRGEVKNWERSGKSQSEYCRERGLDTKTFYNWKSKMKHEQSSKFVAIGGEVSKLGVEVVAPSGVRVCLGKDVPAERIAEVVRCLG